jgi:hypothetical protein
MAPTLLGIFIFVMPGEMTNLELVEPEVSVTCAAAVEYTVAQRQSDVYDQSAFKLIISLMVSHKKSARLPSRSLLASQEGRSEHPLLQDGAVTKSTFRLSQPMATYQS